MPSALQYINYISILRPAVRAVSNNELQDLTFTCRIEERLSNGLCPTSNGIQLLDIYELNDHGVLWQNMLSLTILMVGYRVIAFFMLHWSAKRNHFAA